MSSEAGAVKENEKVTARKGWGDKSWREVTDTILALGLIALITRLFNTIDLIFKYLYIYRLGIIL